jgi:hypothetical protein
MSAVGFRATSASLLTAGFLFAACGRNDDQIKVYRLAKSPTDSPPSLGSDVIGSTNAPVKSTVERVPAAANVTAPSNWEPQPLSQMRQASFLVHGENGTIADISLVTLGPAAGNILDNVNRWLGQLSQDPVSEEKLAKMIEKLPTAHGEIEVVDLSGKAEAGDASKDGRIVAAIASDEGKTAFFKMRGNPQLVSAEKPNFLKWVQSMHSPGTNETTVASAASTTGSSQIKWDVPAGWSPVPASGMRYASFAAVADDGAKIDISVATFPGDGGDDRANVHRWRQQISLPPVEGEPPITPLGSSDAAFSTVDIAGPNARTLAAWTRKDGRAWFFKLTGPNTAVEKEKPNFVKFVQSVRF